MPFAVCLLKDTPHYRRDAFAAGLKACGYTVQFRRCNLGPGDVLVTWNRSEPADTEAKRAAAAGATVLVAENGYLGSDANGHQLYAIAKHHHNGAGEWNVGCGDRFPPRIECSPWRTDGEHILVLPQRGIGPPGVAMPRDWLQDVTARLRKETKRPIRVRDHPGKERPPLEPDLKGAWAVVTWASSAALKAIVAGVPAFHEMPKWIGGQASVHGIGDIEHRYLGDREPMLRRLAWAQWTLEELASGLAFRTLLGDAR